MIQISSRTKIFVCNEILDFRNGFNGTAIACRQKIKQNPLEGGLFVFKNRSRTMIRFYLFDGHGEWCITKRVASGRFKWWKEGKIPSEIVAEHLYLLLRGGNPSKVNFPEPWKRID